MKLKSGYIPSLDGWRTIAILGVIVAHSLRGFSDTSLSAMAPSIVQLGQSGVSVFFGLSGFLISMRLLEEHHAVGSISLMGFYVRRGFRILPPALAYLMVIGCLGWISMLAVSPREWISSLLFARNYIAIAPSYGFYTGHFWSLAIEEHFYLFWPVLLATAGLRRARWIVLALIVAMSVWRNFEFHHHYVAYLFPGVEPSQRTDVRIDSLLCGCMIALLMQLPKISDWFEKSLRLPLFTALAALYLTLVLGLFKLHLHALLVSILCPTLIVATVLHPREFAGRILELPIFRWIGRLSYSLYLWQQLFIFGKGEGNPPLGWLQKFPLNVIMLLLAAMASYYWLEKPMIRLGHRLAAPASAGRTDIGDENATKISLGAGLGR